jgi:hypothetical protein
MRRRTREWRPRVIGILAARTSRPLVQGISHSVLLSARAVVADLRKLDSWEPRDSGDHGCLESSSTRLTPEIV